MQLMLLVVHAVGTRQTNMNSRSPFRTRSARHTSLLAPEIIVLLPLLFLSPPKFAVHEAPALRPPPSPQPQHKLNAGVPWIKSDEEAQQEQCGQLYTKGRREKVML